MTRKVFRLGKIRKGRSERQSVSVINREWLQQHLHILTPRDVEMLKLLKRFPVMTIDHLYTLTPRTFLRNGKEIKPFYECHKGKQICRDRIRRLFDYHFVNKYSPRLPYGEGTSPQYIWLDRAGYRYFEIEGRPAKQLSQEYLHHVDILDVYCTLMELERKGHIKIDYLEVCYEYKPKTSNIEPDILVGFRRGNYGYTYFVEVDTGEKKESEEISKLGRYRDWQLGNHWIREKWATIYRCKFPTVLYIFSGRNKRKSQRRIREFSKVAHEEELRSDFILLENFRDKILNLRT